MGLLRSIPLWVFIISTFLSWWAGQNSQTSWIVKATPLDEEAVQAQLVESGESSFLDSNQSNLWQRLNDSSTDIIQSDPGIYEQWVVDSSEADTASYYHLVVDAHNGFWSVFPALVTIILCFLTREPITSLLAGIISGALILGNYDVMHEVLIPGIASPSAALIIVLYLGFLGSLLGIWSRNGAAQAFADWITHRFVRGPKTAKLSAWLLGIFFFQGGTISTLLVGTTVKPVADKEKISHEELSFIVDATASPIAVLLPFNAWPFYIQGLLYVGGVTALATEELRLAFFFASIPLFFYAILAVLFTFLMSIDRLPFMGKSLKAAIKRSRETGELDRPGSTPLQQSDSISRPNISEGYRPAAFEFFLPLVIIIGIAVGTYLLWDSPNVLWAFAIALIVAALTSRIRGISLKSLIEGVSSGLQGVVYGAVILLLAVVIGGLSRETGGGIFLVELLGSTFPYHFLPLLLFILTLIIAFSTGTSWGTFAVTFPLAMPLAWNLGVEASLDHPVFFLQLCFAAVINGSVFGDQASPISDTTVLSSLATGCDLMDHVRTQIVPCGLAAVISAAGWTALTFFA